MGVQSHLRQHYLSWFAGCPLVAAGLSYSCGSGDTVSCQ
ncbi:hypothetical protein A2U01_0066799, partial [Trifolium medium]|nr:hypothetical protein [Trifolium medium]